MEDGAKDNDHTGEFCELPIHPLAVTFARKLNRDMPVDWTEVLQSESPLKVMEDFMAYVPGSAKAALGRSVLHYLTKGSDPRAFMELLGSLCLLHKHRWCNLAYSISLAAEQTLPEDAGRFIEQVLAARTYEHESWFVESNVLTIKGTAFVRVSSLKSAADLMHGVFGEKSPRKRPWFQLHLSTCVVLMVVAGAFLWANHRVRLVGKTESYAPLMFRMGKSEMWNVMVDTRTGFGWPLVFQTLDAEPDGAEPYAWVYPTPELYRPEKEPPPTKALLDMPDDLVEKFMSPPYVNLVPDIQWSWTCLAANAATAFAVMLLAAVVCEHLLRRPAGRAPVRLHALSFLALAPAAGALVYANSTAAPGDARTWRKADGSPIELSTGNGFWETEESFGWPAVLLRHRIDVSVKTEPEPEGTYLAEWRREWIWTGFAANAGVLIVIIFATALACESLIRRRERARAAAAQEPAP